MDGAVDLAQEQRGVDFLGEQALPAGLGERPVLDRIAARADDPELDPLRLPPVRLREPPSRLVRLRERKRRAPRAENEERGGGDGRALWHRVSIRAIAGAVKRHSLRQPVALTGARRWA